MRIRNKEIRQRRHRKEQKVKQLIAEAKAASKDGKKRAPKPAAPKITAATKPKKPAAPRAKKTEGEAAPKKTRVKKPAAETSEA